MKDNNLFFRNTTASLTATETSSTLTINGTPIHGMALVVNIPKQSVGDTMQVTLQHSTDDSAWSNLLTLATVSSITQASTVPVDQVRRFNTALKYVRTIITVAGTSPDYGAVNVSIEEPGRNWQKVGQGFVTSVEPNA